jgi:hypothetical protein
MDIVDLRLAPGVECRGVRLGRDDPERAGLRARSIEGSLRAAQRLDALDVDETRARIPSTLRDRLLVEVERRGRDAAKGEPGRCPTPRNTIVVPPGSRWARESPGMYFEMSLICCRPRIAIALESKALMDSETSWSRSARLVAVTMTSLRPVTGCGCSCAAALPAATDSTVDTAAVSACEPGPRALR